MTPQALQTGPLDNDFGLDFEVFFRPRFGNHFWRNFNPPRLLNGSQNASRNGPSAGAPNLCFCCYLLHFNHIGLSKKGSKIVTRRGRRQTAEKGSPKHSRASILESVWGAFGMPWTLFFENCFSMFLSIEFGPSPGANQNTGVLHLTQTHPLLKPPLSLVTLAPP